MTSSNSRRHVAVVGAGAAGLTAAIRAAESGARVTLLNAHPKIGLKILMSGGTRCNVTHREVSERDYNGGSRAFVRRVLAAFTVPQTLEWFESLGVKLKLEETGKYFPETDDAQTVLDALLDRCAAIGVQVRSGTRVVRLVPEAAKVEEWERCSESERRAFVAANDAGAMGWRVGIQKVTGSAAFGAGVAPVGKTDWALPTVSIDEWIDANAVVLSAGGLSFPRTGSDGTGYALARSIGHTIVPPVPALTPLAADDPLCEKCQGVTLDAALTLRVSGKKAVEIPGSLLFAHFGYSGPAALDLSRHWLRAEGAERRVEMNVSPGETVESLAAEWLRAAKDSRSTVKRWLAARVPESLGSALCAEAGVDGAIALAQTPREKRAALLRTLTSRELPVSGTLGYEKAEVTAGGIELAEVDPKALQSRKARGVFLIGEILDVEGRLGGFNFQWAWSCGTVAGRSAG